MRTLGIDLSTADKQTGICGIDWTRMPAVVEIVTKPATDALLLTRIVEADRVGIDVPLGWPDEFVDFVSAHHRGAALPECTRPALRLRETDRFVYERTKLRPLSVSADRIGATAMRAASLLATLAKGGEAVDRAGGCRVVEVYPAAALKVWGFASSGYKQTRGRQTRCKLVADLAVRTANWLDLPTAAHAACENSDDVLDALVAALVARAVACGLREPIPEYAMDRARREGWIALPLPDSLEKLAAPGG